jgi:hypothetical protein
VTADPLTLAELSSRDRIEALRRRMASIPARTDGAAAPAVPVEQTEGRFEVRQEAATESSVECPRGSPGDRQTAPTEARGSVVSVDGASSVLLSLLAASAGSGKHAAIIGLPKLGLLAATEMGADLGKCALISSPSETAIDAAAILLDGMDLVVLGLAGADVPPTRARAVLARARSKGACLVVTEGRGAAPMYGSSPVSSDTRVLVRGMDSLQGCVWTSRSADEACDLRPPGWI